MKGHDAVIRILESQSVDTLFTYMSEDNMSLMSKIETQHEGIRLIKNRHEQGALAMSDGYARTTGDIGVCLIGRGPAIAQTGTAMVTARKKGSNVLVIVPEPRRTDGYDIKAFDQEQYLNSTIGSVESIRSHETLASQFRDAIRRVKVGDGPLAVQISWDVLDEAMPEDVDASSIDSEPPARAVPDGRVRPNQARIDEAIEMYVESDAFTPPLVLAGRGAMQSGAKEAIEEFAERTSALLATTLQARDYFADHPYYLGFTGKWGSDLANQHAVESKLVFAVGASLNPYTIDKGHVFGEETEVIHVDQDPGVIGEHAEIDLGIHGDARTTMELLTEELAEMDVDREGELWSDSLREEVAEFDPMNDQEFQETPNTMDPRELVRALDDLLPADRKVVTDAGHFARWVVDGVHAPPEDFTFTSDFASIGLGLPIGIGTAVAADDQPCFAVCGDGGFTMSIQELETAVRHDVDVTIVVMDDSSLSSEYHTLEARGDDPEVARIESADFADVAEAFGADAYRAQSISEVENLADVLGNAPNGPTVVECAVNHYVRHRSKV